MSKDFARKPLREFISVSDVVCADRHQPAITDFHLTMQVKQSFMMPAIFRAISAAAENQDHRIQRLQLRQLAMFPDVIRKLVIWERSLRDILGRVFCGQYA